MLEIIAFYYRKIPYGSHHEKCPVDFLPLLPPVDRYPKKSMTRQKRVEGKFEKSSHTDKKESIL